MQEQYVNRRLYTYTEGMFRVSIKEAIWITSQLTYYFFFFQKFCHHPQNRFNSSIEIFKGSSFSYAFLAYDPNCSISLLPFQNYETLS